MKTILIALVSSFLTISAIAQTVTVTVMGNRNKQISIDGTVYTIEAAPNANRTPMVIPGLALGQHTLEVVNGNPNDNVDDENVSTSFKVRTGYDMQITVRNNGAVQLREVKSKATNVSNHPAQYKTPMSSTTFNTLLNNVKRQSRQSSKYSMVYNAFGTTNNYFTSSQAEQLIMQVTSQHNRVELLKRSYLKVTDAENFSMLYDVLNSQAGINEVTAYVNNYNYNYGTASSSSHNAYMSPMSNASFSNIYQAAQNQYNSSLRMNYIVDAFANTNNYFTSSQARQLILLQSSENDRLILAKTAYRGITDASNFSQVSNLLNTTAARNDLAAYINSYVSGTSTVPNPTNPTYRTPMSDASFNTLYRQVEAEWAPGAELNELRKVFANTSYYFTTAQAKQLIQLVSAEVNRLELAKSSYRTITDPNNFTQMYDIFSSQASRNELANYVNSYSGGTGSTYPPVRQAMTDESYNEMYRTVQNTWGLGAKMSLLSNTFANTAYYFTTAQAKKLIELVSSESNRLTLAKSAYKQIVDPNNYFAQVSQVLSSQTSRTELENYIRGY